MTKINLIMMLLPFVFMVHDYEEIIMFRRWIDRNRGELRKRFPKIESFFTQRGTFDYSTFIFAVGTAHEFILIPDSTVVGLSVLVVVSLFRPGSV